MPRVREILDRFRPAGAPGSATSAGVPVDRQESLNHELAPAFAELEPVQRECDRIRREAEAEAQRRETEAARRAQALVARARSEAEAERAGAAAAARAQIDSETEHSLAQARQQAEAVRRQGEARRPELVNLALARVRDDLRSLLPGHDQYRDGSQT